MSLLGEGVKDVAETENQYYKVKDLGFLENEISER